MSQFAYSQTFHALLKEAQFTKEMLGTGATQIRLATYASKGVYFQAFTSLSTGLERVGKLSIMIDYHADHGKFPDSKYMSKEIGHKLIDIHQRLIAIISKRGLTGEFLTELSDPIHRAILTVLSNFAVGDRYSNINLLVNNPHQNDPMALWFDKVDMPLFESKVSAAKKNRIRQNAQIVDAMAGQISFVLHTSETNEMITTTEDASFRTGMYKAVAPYRQLFVLQIIRFWTQVLSALFYELRTSLDLPHFSEIFAMFYKDDSYFRTRKTWEGL